MNLITIRPRWVMPLTTTLRFLLAGVFLYSGVEKIVRPTDFLATIYDFELVGALPGMIVAGALPWLELILAVALLSGAFSRGALLGSSLLGLIFLFVQLSAIRNGLTVKCGCFGADETRFVGAFTVARTAVFFGVAAVAWCLSGLRGSPAAIVRADSPALERNPSGSVCEREARSLPN